jgi:peptide deformylase
MENRMYESLSIINWPDPRLKQISAPVTEFDGKLVELTRVLLELMRQHKGVGLAAPQVGLNMRLFVMNATGDPADDRIYINPELSDLDGEAEAEEGCLSIPGVHVNVLRAKNARMQAVDLEGKPFEESQTEYAARVWQHETDHLNGILLTDRMGVVAKMSHRRTLKELEDQFNRKV